MAKIKYEEYEVKRAERSDFVRTSTRGFHGFDDLWIVTRLDFFSAYKYVYAPNAQAAVDEAVKSQKGWL